MTIETTVNDLVASVDALKASVANKRAVLDTAAANADVSGSAVVASATAAQASAAAAAASATIAASTAAEVTAFKTAASALNTSTTASQAVTNLLPDMLAKQDPARYPFRGKYPSLVLDFARQSAHSYSPLAGLVRQAITDVVTFTRASTATYTGPDGLIKTAAVNEPRYDYDPLTGECKGLLVEEQRANVAPSLNLPWQITNSSALVLRNQVLSPDGFLAGSVLQEAPGINDVHQIYFDAPLAADTIYTLTVYAKKGTRNIIRLAPTVKDGTYNSSFFNLSSGAITQGSGHTASINPVGGGWFRCSVTYSSLNGAYSTAATRVGVCNSTGQAGYTGESGMYVYLWGAQLEVGAFPTSYIPTPATFTGRTTTATYLDANGVVQTAGVGVARSNAYGYDSDDVLRPIGLLLEGSATNLLLHSQDYTQAVWHPWIGGTGAAPVITAAYGSAPDGTSTAQRVQLALNGGATVNDYSCLQQSVYTTAGTTYTLSVWLKTADASAKQVQLSFYGENPTTVTVTGTWKRFSVTGTASDTGRSFRLALRGTYGTSDSADLLMWGAQHAAGYYATSYIPTTTAQVTRAADTSTSAQVTRSADNASMATASWHSDRGGVIGVKAVTSNTGYITDSAGTMRGVACLHDGTNTNRVRVGCSTGGVGVVTTAGTEQVNITQGTSSAGEHRFAVSVAKNSAKVAFDGTVSTEDPSVILPRITTLNVGRSDYAGGYMSGHIKRLTYYPMTMTNEELQVLTSA